MPIISNGSTRVLLLALLAAILMSIDTASSYSLPTPTPTPIPPRTNHLSQSFRSTSKRTTISATIATRRETLHRAITDLGRVPLIASAAALVTLAPAALPARAVDDDDQQRTQPSVTTTETEEERKARLLKERIAASKKNFRKADSYAKERFTTVDYSCVADTGSPCKDPKSVFPSDGKVEDL